MPNKANYSFFANHFTVLGGCWLLRTHQYWGYENDQKYIARKQKKIDLYNKYGFNLIELQDKEVQNLDDILPRLLLKYGVQAY
jgi:hypothetical protein